MSQLPEASVQSRVQLVKQLTLSCSQQVAEQQSHAQRAWAVHAVRQMSACATVWLPPWSVRALLALALVPTSTGGGPFVTELSNDRVSHDCHQKQAAASCSLGTCSCRCLGKCSSS